jgi:hypothetical protein
MGREGRRERSQGLRRRRKTEEAAAAARKEVEGSGMGAPRSHVTGPM